MVRPAGYQLLCAASGPGALALLATRPDPSTARQVLAAVDHASRDFVAVWQAG